MVLICHRLSPSLHTECLAGSIKGELRGSFLPTSKHLPGQYLAPTICTTTLGLVSRVKNYNQQKSILADDGETVNKGETSDVKQKALMYTTRCSLALSAFEPPSPSYTHIVNESSEAETKHLKGAVKVHWASGDKSPLNAGRLSCRGFHALLL